MDLLWYNIEVVKTSGCGAVGSALPWGGRGRTFKSCHSDQIKPWKHYASKALFFVCYAVS